MKTLVRYKNRKIYDSDIRNYVNFDDILKFILAGEDVIVKEHQTNVDVTATIYAQIIAEVTKQKRIPLEVLKAVIFAAHNKNVDELGQTTYTHN